MSNIDNLSLRLNCSSKDKRPVGAYTPASIYLARGWRVCTTSPSCNLPEHFGIPYPGKSQSLLETGMNQSG